MAATIIGFDSNEMKAQPGLSIRRTENGGWEASHEIVIKADDFAAVSSNFAKGSLLSDIDENVPAPFDEFLRIDTVQFARSEGDLITFQVTATGSNTGQFENEGEELAEAALPTYDLQGQLVDTPFSEHRKWKPLDEKDKRLLGMLIAELYQYDTETRKIFLLQDDNTLRVDVDEQLTADDAHEFATRIQQGKTTYEKSVYVWTETTEGDSQLTPQQLNKLGLIATPRGNPPEPSGTRNYRLTSTSQSQSGELFRTRLEWTLSDDGGHDKFLYES